MSELKEYIKYYFWYF